MQARQSFLASGNFIAGQGMERFLDNYNKGKEDVYNSKLQYISAKKLFTQFINNKQVK